jgi:hypothetical protein
MIKEYKIILMDYDGEMLSEYYSYIVPHVNDTILIDEDKTFTIQARHFSTNHFKVVLLGELEKQEVVIEELKNN